MSTLLKPEAPPDMSLTKPHSGNFQKGQDMQASTLTCFGKCFCVGSPEAGKEGHWEGSPVAVEAGGVTGPATNCHSEGTRVTAPSRFSRHKAPEQTCCSSSWSTDLSCLTRGQKAATEILFLMSFFTAARLHKRIQCSSVGDQPLWFVWEQFLGWGGFWGENRECPR